MKTVKRKYREGYVVCKGGPEDDLKLLRSFHWDPEEIEVMGYNIRQWNKSLPLLVPGNTKIEAPNEISFCVAPLNQEQLDWVKQQPFFVRYYEEEGEWDAPDFFDGKDK